jgi:class 3 adenylate cyclase/tetratricopeptide (TPR) repeat protein
MNCASCKRENPADSAFCEGCGAALAASCPRCGATASTGARFCRKCGSAISLADSSQPAGDPADRPPRDYTPKHLADRILQSKSVIEGERKQVTVLFADVKGSMELAERLDPEEWHVILERFFEILAHGVHRFEGTVNQYTGDGIMALFGAPIAHEDHAQRACFTALYLKTALREHADELRRTRGLSFSTRIGINSGDVVVGKIGDDLRMDYTAQGHTVNLAQRMESLAEPGCVYLAEGTRRLVEGYFTLRPLGEFAVKGVREPVAVSELSGLGSQRTRLDRSRARGFSRFIGRGSELLHLEHALEQSIAGHGRVVGVVADAGTGKSRLCDEFVERCRARELRVLAAHCPAHGRSMAFLPVLELLRAVFGIDERDSDQETRRKIAGELTLLDAKFQSMIPLVFEFLGVPDPARPAASQGADAREQQLLAFVRHLVQARSAREPAVVFVDDLHWVDPGSEAFIAQLVEVAASTRTLVLVNFRPEYRAEWMQQSHYQQIPLSPLGPEEVQQLISFLLGADDSLQGLAEHAYVRSGGNPFFVEEIVQSLVESGRLEGVRGAYRLVGTIEDLEIPPSVHSVLAARIDRLSERDKRVLQVASVIGRTVPEPLLADVAELPARDLSDTLASLQRREFLLQQTMYPEAEYLFKHALTLDVAYASQLAAPRALLHAAVARAVEERAGERLNEQAGLLAHHWESAGEAVTAARWHVHAARWAGLTQGTEMVRHLRKALELLDGTDEQALAAEALGMMLGSAIRVGNLEDGEQLIRRADALARASGDPLVGARITYGIGAHAVFASRFGDAETRLIDAVQLADRAGDPDLQVAARFNLGVCRWFMGAHEDALMSLEAALELAKQNPDWGTTYMGYDSASAALSFLGLVQVMLGNCREAASLANRAIESARERDLASRVLAYSWGAQVAAYCGDRERSLSWGLRAFEIASEVSSSNIQGMGFLGLGVARLANEEWAEGAELFTQLLAESPAHMHHTSHLARCMMHVADHDETLAAAEANIALNAQAGCRSMEAEARLDLVELLTRLPSPPRERMADELARATELIDATEARILRPRIHEIRARLDPKWRERELREAQRLYEQMQSLHAERIAQQLSS